MPLSTYLGPSEPITLDPAVLAASPKPVRDAAKAYDAAVAKWREAEVACVELRARSRDVDHEAAQAALDAARKGEPIPPARLDGIAQSIEAAERAVGAHLRLAQEAEQHLLDTLDEHADAIEAAAAHYAHTVTRRLLDRIGDVLADEWAAYVTAQHVVTACELGKVWLGQTDMAPRFRYDGQDRCIDDLLGGVLRLIERSDPMVDTELIELVRLQRTGSPADYSEAITRYEAMPVPKWAEALGVSAT